MSGGALEATIRDIVGSGTGDDVDASLARDWIESVVATPPPCSPEWAADELDEVRSALGYSCHDLTGCVSVGDTP